VATLVGHHTVRTASGAGASSTPSERATKKMTALVETAMKEGAFGLSTGLEYEPGGLAGADELAAIAEPVGKRNGIVMSHLRSEDDDKIDAALAELLAQCEKAHARAHVAHIKVVLGKGEDRGKALLGRLQAARAKGLEVTADIYPYTASYTTVGILFPPFAKPPNDYGAARAKQKDRLLEHLRKRVTDRNGPEAMIFGTGSYAGQTLAKVAEKEGRPFEQVLLELGPTGASAAYFVMDEPVMETLFKDPFVMIGTDGGGGGLHPRGHGSFSRVIAELVQKKKLVTLEEAVRKMAPLAAKTVGFADERGMIQKGQHADIAIFDPAKIEDVATFARPHLSSKGMKIVVVNGEVAYRDGKPTSARPGHAIRRHETR
jgi:N-acyl-D-aspartate/D-glutamate deacylase